MPAAEYHAVEADADGGEAGKPKKWIGKAIKKPGALHRDLHVPEGQKIPEAKLEKATRSENPKIRHRAELAETLKGMHHGGEKAKPESRAERLYRPKKVRKA